MAIDNKIKNSYIGGTKMINITASLSKQQLTPQIMKLINYEEQAVTRHFEEVGKDIRLTLENLSDGKTIQKTYYLDLEEKSFDSRYFRTIVKHISAIYAEGNFLDFSKLIGKLFIVGIEETFSNTTLQTYQNIVIFLPVESEFAKQIPSL